MNFPGLLASWMIMKVWLENADEAQFYRREITEIYLDAIVTQPGYIGTMAM